MDTSFDPDDRRRTITIAQPQRLYHSDSESYFEDSLDCKIMDDTITNESEIQNDESEDDTMCDQLRGMSPEKINQLLNKLDLNDENLADAEVQRDSESDEYYEEEPQPKKGKPTKVKKELKTTKGKKVHELEHDDKKDPTTTNVDDSKEDIAKTGRPKRGQKGAAVESFNINNDDKTVPDSKTTESVIPPEVFNDKKLKVSKGKAQEDNESDEHYEENPQPKKGKPTKVKKELKTTKGKNANELEHDDKKESIPIKVGDSKGEIAKTERPKRGQKGADLDSLNSKDSHKAVASSNSSHPEVSIDKKSNKSKKGKGKEDSEEKDHLPDEKLHAKEIRSKTDTYTKIPNLTEKTATKDKNPPNKKKQGDKEAMLKEKTNKSTKKTANETDDLKVSKSTEDDLKPNLLSADDGKISSRTRANKSPSQENKQDEEIVKLEHKTSGKPRKNKNQTDQPVSKPTEKEADEKPKRKVNGGKSKVNENVENKENEAKITKVKAKTETTKQVKPIDSKENIVKGEKVVTKRVTRKNK